MEIYTSPIFLIIVIVSSLIIIGFYYFSKKTKNVIKLKPIEAILDSTEDKISQEILALNEMSIGVVPIRLADNISSRIFNSFISEELAKDIITKSGSLGRQWDREGKKLYGLNRYIDVEKNTKLRPIPIPMQISNAPTALHNDLKQPEIAIVVSEMLKSDAKKMSDEFWKHLPWLVALGFLAFLWATA